MNLDDKLDYIEYLMNEHKFEEALDWVSDQWRVGNISGIKCNEYEDIIIGEQIMFEVYGRT